MDRYDAIQNPPPDPYKRYDAPRAELTRRLDAQLAQDVAEEAGKAV